MLKPKQQKVQASEERNVNGQPRHLLDKEEDSLVKIALWHKKCREQASYAACHLFPRRTTRELLIMAGGAALRSPALKVPSIVLRDQPTSVSAKLACTRTVRTAYVSLLPCWPADCIKTDVGNKGDIL